MEGNEGYQSKDPMAAGKREDMKNNTKDEPMSIDDNLSEDQPATLTASGSATLTAAESAAIPTPIQPQNVKVDEKRPVVFSIGSTPLPASQVGAPQTNADQQPDNNSGIKPGPINVASTSAAAFQTNADIPQEMMTPPFSAPPTAHKHIPTVGKQNSTPQLSNTKDVIPEALNESRQHVYSQFSEAGLKDKYQSQMSFVDIPSRISPAQKVSMEDEAIMQRQQQRFKLIEEQNKTKPLQFKQTYSDPYSCKYTERVQAKQKRGQG